ncbi:HDOD domain-containing protein [Desulfosoma caldarium]|uniref:Putative nucleotidyltransferase with HDIG domain n=1 Tax=Desulfosoma caldarium TaxID=610254 RepID=A0A3N1UHL0_9BACT|nr:HDOD domain-containing protein [Desulfosoma caldarium]ROQ90755.1 putative nucleotidyltransferase with HDIG domain [Desulfosoma caldarium]
MERATTLQDKPLDEILRVAENLPPFPDVVQKVMPLLQRMAPVEDIETVIQYDQAIAAKVLALARSPHFRRTQQVRSLKEAIISLGQKALVEVILAACSARFQDDAVKGYDLREGELWEHAVGTAIMADRIAERVGSAERLTAYTAGLLHDIGKTVLNQYVEHYLGGDGPRNPIVDIIKTRRQSFLEAERNILGIDHQELGGLIARRWNFPPAVVAGITYHHNPQDAEESHQVAAIVYAANRMVGAMGIGTGVDGFLNPNQDHVFEALKLDARTIERLMADVFVALDETKKFLTA